MTGVSSNASLHIFARRVDFLSLSLQIPSPQSSGMLMHHTTLMIIVKVTPAVSSLLAKVLSPAHLSNKKFLLKVPPKLNSSVSTTNWVTFFGHGISSKLRAIQSHPIFTLSLAKNGYVSSSKRTKHINAKYLYIKHHHALGELTLQYFPTEEMWADVLTKPLQGSKFRQFRSILMNCPEN